MERSGLTPDVWTYNSLANVLGSCGDWERALGLLKDMRDRGLTPDVVTYSALVSACEKAGQVCKIIVILIVTGAGFGGILVNPGGACFSNVEMFFFRVFFSGRGVIFGFLF